MRKPVPHNECKPFAFIVIARNRQFGNNSANLNLSGHGRIFMYTDIGSYRKLHWKLSASSIHTKLITSSEYPNVMWRISSYLFIYLRFSIDNQWTGNSIDISQKLNLTLQNICSTLMRKLWIFAILPIYNLMGNVISATAGFVCINLQP